MEGFGPSTYGDAFADVYESWYGDITDAEATARFVHRRCPAGAVLELGVGTGRLAVPLVTAGRVVVGVDASARMLAEVPELAGLSLVRGDMRLLPFRPGAFGGVLLGFNTLFGLASAAEQTACLAQCRTLLSAEGRIIVEAFVPGDEPEGGEAEADDGGPGATADGRVEITRLSADEVVLRISRTDRQAQEVTGQHVSLTEDGIRLRPWRLRWSTPNQLDEMAAQAGLELVERSGGWSGEPFDSHSPVHVSVYVDRPHGAPVKGQLGGG